MTRTLTLVGDPFAEPETEQTPKRRGDSREEIRRVIERDHAITDRVRAAQGLPPLYDRIPAEGACSPWQPGATGDTH
jgi:hypothetical protein